MGSGCERVCEMLLYVMVSCTVVGSRGCKVSHALCVSVYFYGCGRRKSDAEFGRLSIIIIS